jgi:TP901 family phage tail tape measure protein
VTSGPTLNAYLNLIADGFQEGMNQAQDAVEGLQNKFQEAQRQLMIFGAALTASAAGAGIGFGQALAQFSGLEQAIRDVQVIAGGTTDTFAQLAAAAQAVGETSRLSAVEAAAGLRNLVAAGFSAEEAIAALNATASLALATGENLASSSELLTSVINQFGFTAAEAGRVADILVGSINASAASVYRLQNGFSAVGPTAAALGISLEDITAALSVLIDRGFEGEVAGTALRNIFLDISNPATLAKAGIEGVTEASAAFAEGGLVGFLEALGTRTLDATEAFKLFGAYGTSAFLALQAAGPSALREMEAAIAAQGDATATAQLQMDTLLGSIEEFTSSIESAAETVGGILAPVFRPIIDAVTGLVRAFLAIPDPIQAAIVLIAAAGTALTGFIGTVLVVVPLLLKLVGVIQTFALAIGLTSAPLAYLQAQLLALQTVILPALIAQFAALRVAILGIIANPAAFASWLPLFGMIGRGAGMLLGQLRALLPIIGRLTRALAPWGIALLAVTETISGIGRESSMLQNSLANTGNALGRLFSAIKTTFAGIGNAIAPVVSQIGVAINGVFRSVGDTVSWLTDQIGYAASKLAGLIEAANRLLGFDIQVTESARDYRDAIEEIQDKFPGSADQIQQLEALKTEYAGNKDAIEAIDRAIEQANSTIAEGLQSFADWQKILPDREIQIFGTTLEQDLAAASSFYDTQLAQLEDFRKRGIITEEQYSEEVSKLMNLRQRELEKILSDSSKSVVDAAKTSIKAVEDRWAAANLSGLQQVFKKLREEQASLAEQSQKLQEILPAVYEQFRTGPETMAIMRAITELREASQLAEELAIREAEALAESAIQKYLDGLKQARLDAGQAAVDGITNALNSQLDNISNYSLSALQLIRENLQRTVNEGLRLGIPTETLQPLIDQISQVDSAITSYYSRVADFAAGQYQQIRQIAEAVLSETDARELANATLAREVELRQEALQYLQQMGANYATTAEAQRQLYDAQLAYISGLQAEINQLRELQGLTTQFAQSVAESYRLTGDPIPAAAVETSRAYAQALVEQVRAQQEAGASFTDYADDYKSAVGAVSDYTKLASEAVQSYWDAVRAAYQRGASAQDIKAATDQLRAGLVDFYGLSTREANQLIERAFNESGERLRAGVKGTGSKLAADLDLAPLNAELAKGIEGFEDFRDAATKDLAAEGPTLIEDTGKRIEELQADLDELKEGLAASLDFSSVERAFAKGLENTLKDIDVQSKAFFKALPEQLIDTYNQTFKKISDQLKKDLEKIIGPFGDSLAKALESGLVTPAEAAAAAVEKAMEEAGKRLETTAQNAENSVKGIVDRVNSFVNSTMPALNNVLDRASNLQAIPAQVPQGAIAGTYNTTFDLSINATVCSPNLEAAARQAWEAYIGPAVEQEVSRLMSQGAIGQMGTEC